MVRGRGLALGWIVLVGLTTAGCGGGDDATDARSSPPGDTGGHVAPEAGPPDGASDAGVDTGASVADADTSSDGAEGGVEPPPPPCDPEQTKAIEDSFADPAIPLDVGAVAMIQDPSCGRRYFTRGASKDVPETALHLIGSRTKTYIASLVLLLVEDGELSLSDPATKWIPNVPGGDAVEVEHLLRHTSGIYNYTSDPLYMSGSMFLHQTYTPQELLNIAFGEPPSFAPGEAGKWEYSNTNYVMLAMIVEAVTGKGVAEVLRERILGPIGANATFYAGPEPVKGDVAFGRTFLGSNGATALDPSATWGCGNMVATMGDLVDWGERREGGSSTPRPCRRRCRGASRRARGSTTERR